MKCVGVGTTTLSEAVAARIASRARPDTTGYSGARERDSVLGGADADVMFGGSGNDLMHGEWVSKKIGGDEMHGGLDDDCMCGENRYSNRPGGNDTMYGDKRNDRVAGFSSDDSLYGDEADDLLIGEANATETPGDFGDGGPHELGYAGGSLRQGRATVDCEALSGES